MTPGGDLVPGAPFPPRAEWARLAGEEWDLAVIGGGIHGAGVARDAALRGFSTLLLERDDWASGTSSRSSKLLHGGLRYLRDGRLGLVREALRERDLHLRLAPGHVRRVTFRVPPVPPSAPPRWQIRAGIALYGLLAGEIGGARFWEPEPSYEDAMVDDARFCLDLVLDARRRGVLALNYVEAGEPAGPRARKVRDRLCGETATVRARVWVNAAGPWADRLPPRGKKRLRLTRGTHVVLNGREDDDARLFFAPSGGRVLFLLPFGDGASLLGTTDLDEADPVPDPAPWPEEIVYLRDAFRSRFPEWAGWRAVGALCGLRPLLNAPGDPSRVSREERVEVDAGAGIVTILGGKYTTYRSAAEKAVDAAADLLGRGPQARPTRTEPIPSSAGPGSLEGALARAWNEEDAVRFEDALFRRTTLGLRGEAGAEVLDRAAGLWAARWGRSRAEALREARRFEERTRERWAALSAWTA